MKGKSSSKSKGKNDKEEEKKDDKLKTCNHVKARHILCEKLSKIQTAYDALSEQYGNKPPATEFAKYATELSECPSGKKGGDLGWFPRGKMVGDFQNVAFNTPVGQMSNIFKSTHGYHIILVEGRKA